MDKRSKRIQPIRLMSKFFPIDIHKSMFINDLMITIPKYYAESWGKKILDTHNRENYKWKVEIEYQTPKLLGRKKLKYESTLSLSFIKDRTQTSCYRLKWSKDFAVQLAKDYPKSFVRSLEYHIGDEYYKEKGFTEFDVGGFKEQLQIKIGWENDCPKIEIKEYFRVREESQDFPNIYKELSSYLIADYLLSDEKEILRRVQVSNWKPRSSMENELNENNIYILLNREKNQKEIYFGETKKSLSKRYPINQKHHSFDDWKEYSVIQLPPETSNHTRLLIERVLIVMGTKIFENNLSPNDSVLKGKNVMKLMNKKK